MLIALFMQFGKPLSLLRRHALYGVSVLFCCLLIVIQDLANYNFLVSSTFAEALPFYVDNNDALVIYSLHLLVLVLMPCVYLLYVIPKRERRQLKLLLLIGAMLIPLMQLFGHHTENGYWLIYLGAVFTASCWMVAVFIDLQRTRGRAYVIKDELLHLLRSGTFNEQKLLDRLWLELAKSVDGDTRHYQLLVRELLARLADLGVSAGVNQRDVLQRLYSADEIIRGAEDVEVMRHIASEQTKALGLLIQDSERHSGAPHVAKATEYIQRCYATIVDVSEIIEHCSVSRSYLMAEFKKRTGVTINQYLIRVRIDAACRLLATRTITQTAFEVGFNNSNYFGTVFKKVIGKTPREYQQVLNERAQ